jgi:multidrug resistance efflux pump
MEMLLILTYTAIVYVIFRLFKIPLTKWTGTTAVVGGAVLLFFILLLMNYNHPFTKEARFYFNTTPIVPAVRGLVVEVPVAANTPLKRGDVLFRIDPRSFEYVVQQKRAALAEATQNVRSMGADVERAQGQVAEATASRDRNQQSYERYAQGNESARRAGRDGPFSPLEIENRRQVYLASEGSLSAAQAQLERAQLSLSSTIDGVNTTVARLQAELGEAEYDLSQTVVRAPTDGFVSQLILHPGMMATPLPLRPVMVFVHREDRMFGAAFQQNALQRVRVGDEAEIAFDALPGRIVRGRVQTIIDVMVQGQLQPTGTLLDPEDRPRPGRVVAIVEVLEDLSAERLPGGASGQVALYTSHWHEFAIIRRILLRMKSWQNYVFTEGH